MSIRDWLSSIASIYQDFSPQGRYLRTAILKDPHYRLQSTRDIAVAAALGVKIDANRASVDDWLRLPGLSIHQARSLVDLNRSGVQFYCLEDIAAALGLPLQQIQPLEPLLSFRYYNLD